MSYLEPSDAFSPAHAIPFLMLDDYAPAPVETAPAETGSFQPTEWTVIEMARHDSLATLHTPQRSKLSRLLFGQPRSYSLSAERLEALRALAVEAWHRPLAISPPALGAFITAGFSGAQLGLLLNTTGALRTMAGQSVSPPIAA